jgi:hypothetical protein
MKTKTINLLELSDYQKAKVLKQARIYLQQQLEEARYCSSMVTAHKIDL